MSDLKEVIKNFLLDLITSPQFFLPVGAAIAIFVLFLIACQRIRVTDKSGKRVKAGTKASDLVRSGEIPGVVWPDPSPPAPPGAMIVGPGMTGSVKKIVFVRTDHGHYATNGPDTIDLTSEIKSIAFSPDTRDGETQPIEVASDGITSEDRSGDDQDRERARAERRTNSARRSRARRRAPRRER